MLRAGKSIRTLLTSIVFCHVELKQKSDRNKLPLVKTFKPRYGKMVIRVLHFNYELLMFNMSIQKFL